MITDGGGGTLTPTNFGSGSTITFNDAGDTATLLFTNSKYYLIATTPHNRINYNMGHLSVPHLMQII